ncbi:MAG: gliding motility-associated C-terminal domain-containing protein, partial [Bacteroidetes bacterium]|nr:gliding motility-associated C-terminal domain-containing protein [Bacteroidota bacterium]
MNTATLNITVFAQPSVTISKSDLVCYNVCNGSMTATVSSGTSPFTYSWNSGCMNSSCTNLCTGTNTVTVTDINGCTTTANATITEPPALSLTVSATPATCGQTNGSATANASGGTGSYTYLWNDPAPAQVTQTANGLSGGVYTVTVTDANGCTITGSATVNSVAGGNVTIAIGSNITCSGLCNGSATASMTGGTSPFTYSWSTVPVQNTSTVTGLCALTYSVTVTDANGCSGTANITMTQPALLTASVTSYTDLSCYNTCTGTMTISASGGTGSYNYQWNPVVSLTNSATGLCANTFTVTVSDANGCSAAVSQTLTQPALLSVSLSGTPASCAGVCDGTSTATATGGTSPYTWQWDNNAGSQTTSTTTGLCGGGSYSVTATDSKGCTVSGTYSISVMPSIVLSVTTINATCGLPNGTVSVTAVNGTPPYIAVWSNGCNNDTCTNLLAGPYSVTVTDSKGCSQNATANLSNSMGPTVTLTNSANPRCAGSCDGSATVLVTDGIPPYSYFWNTSPIQTNPTATGLCSGTWSVLVVDDSACVATININLADPPVLALTVTGTSDISCNGQCNGSISVSPSGGTPPYTYSWSNGSSGSSAAGLCAGNYQVTVTDANACTAAASATINEPAALFVFVIADSASCNGTCDGGAIATASGGTATYSYLWSNSIQTPIVNNLCPGLYTVTVTDAKGCLVMSAANVLQPQTVIVAITGSGNVTCNGSGNGWAQSVASGGTSPFTYQWSNNQQTGQTTNLSGGEYTVTVSDLYGCTGSASVIITEPLLLTIVVTGVNTSCFGVCDGSGTAIVSGGVTTYTYLWDGNAQFQNSAAATGLCAGSFSVTVTDFNGCQVTGNVNITQPQILSFNATPVSSTCGNPNGSACVSIIGGLSPYTVVWDDPLVTNGLCLNNVNAGVYNPVVTDGNGCTYTYPVIINDLAGPTIDTIISTDVTCSAANNGTAIAAISSGTPPYTYTWQKGAVVIATGTLTVFNLNGGTYSFTVIDGNNCVSSQSFTVYEPVTMVSAIISATNVTCYGSCNGQLTVAVAGGSSPYTYQWGTVPVQNTPSATNLCAGLWSVVIYDASGCSTTSQGTVTQPAALSLNPVIDSVDCYGGNDGTISLLPGPGGGTPPYTYTWLPAGTGSGPVVTNLFAGQYSIILSDYYNCQASQTVTVYEPMPLMVSTTANDERCNNSNGSVAAFVLGGTSPYTYFWVPGGYTSSIVSGIPAGNYTVFVSDYHGCAESGTVQVNEIAGPEINVQIIQNVQCNGSNNGSAQVVFVSQGTLPYSYSWTPNVSTAGNASNLYAGLYTVMVTDSNGCSDTDTLQISQPPALTVTCTPAILTICYGDSTKVFAVATGGVAPYTYNWNEPGMTGQGPHTVKPFANTIYVVSVTDANGCLGIGSSSIDVRPPLDVQAPDVVICAGDSAILTASATGGNGNYTYIWSNQYIGSSQVVTGLTSQTIFDVTVVDNCSLDDFTTMTVLVNPLPVVQFTADRMEGCEPLAVQFTDNSTVTGSSIVSWQWDFGDNSGSALQNPYHLYAQDGAYSVSLTVSSSAGCSASYTWLAMIWVYPLPDAFFIPKPRETTSINPIVNFTDQSTGTIAIWHWDFGDPGSSGSNISGVQNPSHEYSDTGTYVITLLVTTDRGCTDTYTDSIRIKNEYILFIPSAFTPNGDGDNEYFFPYVIGLNKDKFEFYIFDRWGDQIFHSDDVNKPWDGTANSGYNMSQQDVYIWYIRTEDLNGVDHEYIGHVTLVK